MSVGSADCTIVCLYVKLVTTFARLRRLRLTLHQGLDLYETS